MMLSTTELSKLHEANYREDRLEALNHFYEDLCNKKVADGYIYSLSRYGKIFANGAGDASVTKKIATKN